MDVYFFELSDIKDRLKVKICFKLREFLEEFGFIQESFLWEKHCLQRFLKLRGSKTSKRSVASGEHSKLESCQELLSAWNDLSWSFQDRLEYIDNDSVNEFLHFVHWFS